VRTAHLTKQFQRDVKLQKRRGKDTGKLRAVFACLVEEKRLPERCHDHSLVGEFSGYRECHVEPDWLLIYKIEGQSVYFVRTGTHSDLFD